MRRLVLLTVLVLGLAVPAAAFGLVYGVDDGTLSVRNGNGRVSLNFNGSVVARISHGWIRVTDPVLTDGAGFDFWGCDNTRVDRSDTTAVCSGNNIRFRAVGGKYQVYVKGSGMYLSAVGHGTAVLDGRGETPYVDYDGVFSFNDEPYRSLPNAPTPYELAAPSGG
jgi:hypothetical protein